MTGAHQQSRVSAPRRTNTSRRPTFHNTCGVHSSATAYGRGSGWCPVHTTPVYKDGQDWLTDHAAARSHSRSE